MQGNFKNVNPFEMCAIIIGTALSVKLNKLPGSFQHRFTILGLIENEDPTWAQTISTPKHQSMVMDHLDITVNARAAGMATITGGYRIFTTHHRRFDQLFETHRDKMQGRFIHCQSEHFLKTAVFKFVIPFFGIRGFSRDIGKIKSHIQAVDLSLGHSQIIIHRLATQKVGIPNFRIGFELGLYFVHTPIIKKNMTILILQVDANHMGLGSKLFGCMKQDRRHWPGADFLRFVMGDTDIDDMLAFTHFTVNQRWA